MSTTSAPSIPATLVDTEVTEIFISCNSDAPMKVLLQRVCRPDLQLTISKQCDLWAFVWTSSSILASICANIARSPKFAAICEPKDVQYIEIGAGSGLASISAAMCDMQTIATDLVNDALELIRLNAVKNGCIANIKTLQYDWHKDTAELRAFCDTSDRRLRIVAGADILFLSSNVRPVLKTITALLQHNKGSPSVAVLVDPGRTARDDFESELEAFGLVLHCRKDYCDVSTSIATMKECTIFVVRARATDEEGVDDDAGVFRIIEAAIERSIHLDADTERRYGYTLAASTRAR